MNSGQTLKEKINDMSLRRMQVLDSILNDLTTDQMQERIGISHAGIYYHHTRLLKLHGVDTKEELKKLYEPTITKDTGCEVPSPVCPQ